MSTQPCLSKDDGQSGGRGENPSVDPNSKIVAAAIAKSYDRFADKYDENYGKERLRTFLRDVFNKFPQHGFTLDLGCGTGAAGMLIRKSALNSDNNPISGGEVQRARVYVHGVDISPRMLTMPWCREYYDSTDQALLQDVLMDTQAAWVQHAIRYQGDNNPGVSTPQVDHIVCFGALHFVKREQFNAVLSRMFELARRSIMFDIDDLTPDYIESAIKSEGEGFRNYNHVDAYRQFRTPDGWVKVAEEETVIYHSCHLGIDVRGFLLRFERTE